MRKGIQQRLCGDRENRSGLFETFGLSGGEAVNRLVGRRRREVASRRRWPLNASLKSRNMWSDSTKLDRYTGEAGVIQRRNGTHSTVTLQWKPTWTTCRKRTPLYLTLQLMVCCEILHETLRYSNTTAPPSGSGRRTSRVAWRERLADQSRGRFASNHLRWYTATIAVLQLLNSKAYRSLPYKLEICHPAC